MVNIKYFNNNFHIFYNKRLIYIMPLIKSNEVPIRNMSSFCYTYTFILEPKLVACGFIVRFTKDASEI